MTAAAQAPAGLSEADLWRLWEGQRFPASALVTVDGSPVRVIYRGRPNPGAGPDFRDAIVATRAGPVQGDVELHVRSSDFQRHGHAADPAYDGVVLHVVFRHDAEGPTRLASGACVPVVALADWTERRARELRRWLLSGARYEEPCRSAVARAGAEDVAAALDRLGDMRFRARAAALARRSREAGAEQALWEALAEAAGYGAAGRAFSELGVAVPWAELRARLEALRPRDRAAAAERILSGSLRLAGGGSRRGRPGGSPARRLRGLAEIAGRLAGRGPESVLSRVAARPGSLIALLTVSGQIGRGRAVEIAANAVLPWLAAQGGEMAALRAYAALPLPERYGNVRHLHEAVAGAFPVSARRQQGMLYLLKQYCSRGGCGRCPLS